MIDYPALHALSEVIRTGSFERAAQALGVTPSAVSQRVRNLEERLGAVLVRRGPPCSATEAGAQLCRHLAQVALLESDLAGRLPGLAAPGARAVPLPVAVNADSLGTWFLPAAAAFARETGFCLDLVVEDQEHSARWLREGRVLAAITAEARAVPGCKVQALGSLRYLATASPGFRARYFPAGVTGAALGDAPVLGFNAKDRLQEDWQRRYFGAAALAPAPRHQLPSTEGFVQAARLGMGWGMNPEALVAEDLASGRLVELSPGTPLDVPLYWQINRLTAEALAPLTRAVRAAARQSLQRRAVEGSGGGGMTGD